eukprot:7678265-Heterocapsa_arctica.AAC.1
MSTSLFLPNPVDEDLLDDFHTRLNLSFVNRKKSEPLTPTRIGDYAFRRGPPQAKSTANKP